MRKPDAPISAFLAKRRAQEYMEAEPPRHKWPRKRSPSPDDSSSPAKRARPAEPTSLPSSSTPVRWAWGTSAFTTAAVKGDSEPEEPSKLAVREAIEAGKTPLERITDEITSVDQLRARKAEIISVLQKSSSPDLDCDAAKKHLDAEQTADNEAHATRKSEPAVVGVRRQYEQYLAIHRIAPYPIDTLRAALFLDNAVWTRHVNRDTAKRHRAGLETLRRRLDSCDDAGPVQSERDELYCRLTVLVIAKARPGGLARARAAFKVPDGAAVELDGDEAPLAREPARPSISLNPATVALANAIVSCFTSGEAVRDAASEAALARCTTVDATLAAMATVVAGWD